MKRPLFSLTLKIIIQNKLDSIIQTHTKYISLYIFRGSIMSLNVWRITLTVDEMVKMTQASDSFKCSPLVVQEKELILRWRDLLHYSSSGIHFIHFSGFLRYLRVNNLLFTR